MMSIDLALIIIMYCNSFNDVKNTHSKIPNSRCLIIRWK